MQTYRECERDLLIPFVAPFPTCSAPIIFADYVCGIGPPGTSAREKASASRHLMFGGGHLHLRYNVAVLNSTDMPCSLDVKIVTALVKLPLAENDVAPAYLPNLAVARSQLSTIPTTSSDTDEDILFWTDEQVFFTNVACNDANFDPPRPCYEIGCDLIGASDLPVFALLEAGLGVRYGSQRIEREVKTKRRLKEREALFLYSAFIYTLPVGAEDYPFSWPVRRTVNFRYAVR